MPRISTAQRRWLLRFAVAFGLLLGLVGWANSRFVNLRDPPFDFRRLTEQQIYIADDLTRRQAGSLKLGYAEGFDPPEIGLFGNHVFTFFGTEAFDRPGDTRYFFNYWFANLALPEMERYLRHLESIGRLPKKLILVQITSPNIDNGLFVINYGYELPPDLLWSEPEGRGFFARIAALGSFAWQVTENWLHETLYYSTFLLGLLADPERERVIDPTTCQVTQSHPALERFAARAPQILREFLDAYILNADPCDRSHWGGGLRRDGSTNAAYVRRPKVRDQDTLLASERGLNAGDETQIARQMRAIAAIGERHGIKTVFVVPPAYESNRADSVVNQVFDRGLALAPELTVIDDRGLHDDASLFVDYAHPAPKYFRLLVAELRRRGLLPEAAR